VWGKRADRGGAQRVGGVPAVDLGAQVCTSSTTSRLNVRGYLGTLGGISRSRRIGRSRLSQSMLTMSLG
jgi:hypothetical protein